jgi:hypothetical protein
VDVHKNHTRDENSKKAIQSALELVCDLTPWVSVASSVAWTVSSVYGFDITMPSRCEEISIAGFHSFFIRPLHGD